MLIGFKLLDGIYLIRSMYYPEIDDYGSLGGYYFSSANIFALISAAERTGSPMFEVLNHYLLSIQQSDVLSRLNLEAHKYFVVSAHREENINNEKNFLGLLACLNLMFSK